jgi:DNA-binding protein YbaB
MARKTVEIKSNDGGVVVVARGDMTIKSITLDPALVQNEKPERLAKLIASTVNGALESCKKAAAAEMADMTGGLGGLSDMLGGMK